MLHYFTIIEAIFVLYRNLLFALKRKREGKVVAREGRLLAKQSIPSVT
jgi:hypothetical protein